MTRQMTGGGKAAISTGIRLHAGLKASAMAYAASRRASFNMIINEALYEYLAAKGQKWVDEIGTAGAGEKA